MKEVCYSFLCFEPMSTTTAPKIFGFSEFLTAVALLAIVYTIVDVRYKFRIAVTPGSLYVTTFILIGIIGLQSLLTEVWVAESWWVPKTVGITRARWQGFCGLLFLCTVLTWIYYAYINPPVFGRRNARRYALELYRYILRGNDDELKIVANELARSAKTLITSCEHHKPSSQRKKPQEQPKKKKAGVEDYAHDILLLIANRKFCRNIVASSPVTAQALFEEMALVKYDVPLGQFARNISSEAVEQRCSFLYDEAEGYFSGLLGYLKPVSQAVYGNYSLVEGLARGVASPLDIHYEEQWAWDAKKWEAYCRAILLTLTDYLAKGHGSCHSYALVRALHSMESGYRDIYKLGDVLDLQGSDLYQKLYVITRFIKDAIELIDKQSDPPEPLCRVREGTYPKNIYDHLAMLIFSIIFNSSTIKASPDVCWSIHHNTVWDMIFGISNNGRASKIIGSKVCRLLYDEIIKMEKFPNYKGARILGYCLYVAGMEKGIKSVYGKKAYALARAVHSWTRKHYLWLRQENEDVADSVLIGSLSYDEVGKRLVKTYFKGLNREAPKSFLDLQSPAKSGGCHPLKGCPSRAKTFPEQENQIFKLCCDKRPSSLPLPIFLSVSSQPLLHQSPIRIKAVVEVM